VFAPSSTAAGVSVVIETTPPMASLPYSEDAGPRSTSTRCTNARSTKLRPESEKLPMEKPPAEGMPSTSTATRLPVMPRTVKVSRPKRNGSLRTLRPGS
jgi:hypothetical protein